MARKNNFLKNKRAEGVFGMSFGMIFSIILIVFFIIVAFIAVRYFLNFQSCSQIGMFFNNLQSDVDDAMNAGSADFFSNSSLPSGVKYICFVNMSSAQKGASNTEKEIFDYIKKFENWNANSNLYIYAPEKKYCMNWKTIKNIDISAKNPICVKNIKGIISVKLERSFEDTLVGVSA